MLSQLISLSDTATAAATATNNGATVGQKLSLGGSVAVLGLAIVFFGLVLLIFITWLYPKIVKALIPKAAAGKERRKARKAERLLAKAQKKAIAKEPVKAEQAVSKPEEAIAAENDPALIAVITAAIAASMGTSSNGIVIRSLRRSHSAAPAWGASSRIEQVNNRL